jgi:hypothetical protein
MRRYYLKSLFESSIFRLGQKFTSKDIAFTRKAFFLMLTFFLIWDFYYLFLENRYYSHLNAIAIFKLLQIQEIGDSTYISLLISLISCCIYNASKRANKLSIFLNLILYFIIAGNYESNFAPILSSKFFHVRTIPLYGILIFLIHQFTKKLPPFLPISMLQVLIGFVYLGPTIARIKRAGLPGWYCSENFQYILINSWMNNNEYALWLAQHEVLLTIGVWFIFIWEATFLLSVLFPPLTGLYLIGAIVFHSQAELSLEVNYIFYFLAAYSCFLNKTYREIILHSWPRSQKTQ